jgi:UDP-N-acetyl-D-mannosaminuronic acid dehydrogenase
MLRSTVYPGISENISDLLRSKGIQTLVSFCPERIAEGIAMREIRALPQIIGAESEEAFKLSEQVFQGVTPSYIRTTFKEAEISKLFANSYRYLKFAVANEFFMLCINSGINWENVWHSLKKDYPRASDLPYPGLAAGPCLVKDTLQLDYFADKGFSLGQASLNINEGLPLYIIEQIKKAFDLENLTVGILGMTFKAGVDDFRSSLSFRLKDELLKVSKKVLCSDPILQKSYFVSINELIEYSDIIIVATPHLEYAKLEFNQPTVDIWRITSTKSMF